MMVCDCITVHVVGELVLVEGTVDHRDYIAVLD